MMMTMNRNVDEHANYVSAVHKVDGFWVVRAGVQGECHHLFMDRHVIALSDPKLGDLSKMKHTRDSLKELYIQENAVSDTRSVSGITGKFFRFIHEVEPGDFVLYPSLSDRMIYVGLVIGQYVFDSECGTAFPHRRAVKWFTSFPANSISEGCKREIGAARTFFKLLRSKEEIVRVIQATDYRS